MDWWLAFTSLLMVVAAVGVLIAVICTLVWFEDNFDFPAVVSLGIVLLILMLTVATYVSRLRARGPQPAEAGETAR